MQIGGIQWTSLLDYPDHIAATVFTAGCNLRCPFCHNPELVLPELVARNARLLGEAFFRELADRRGFLDAVVITGGEPTLQPDLGEICSQIRALGFLVKLDTNGTAPDILQRLLADGSIDYVAMDVKAPFDDYARMAGVPVDPEAIVRSIDLIIHSDVAYEFRTTAAPGLSTDALLGIGQTLHGARRYWLQRFVVADGKGLVDDTLRTVPALERSDLEAVWSALRDRFEIGGVRG
jgi:pyruvate formate lyase activating enzyme